MSNVDSQSEIISIQSVTKRFGEVIAVNNADLEIGEGEFFSVLGPSGCGKTTLLRMLAGFETPSEGEIYIDQQPMSMIPPHLRPVNMVFQSYAIFPHLDVGKNIAFGLRKSGLSKKEIESKVQEMLDLIALPGYAKRAPTQLSGGERQRVALARALIKRPKVLLLDEPLGALDKKLREQMQLELRALQKSVGITFVFVTHDQEEALTLSDRIAVMSGGRVLQVEAPVGLYERPTSRFVADFIGTMNFFEGKMYDSSLGTARVDAGPLGMVNAVSDNTELDAGQPVTIAIRPEKIRLHLTEPNNVENMVEARIGAASYLGDRSHFQVFLAEREEPVAVAVQNMQAESRTTESEQSVWLSFSSQSVVILRSD